MIDLFRPQSFPDLNIFSDLNILLVTTKYYIYSNSRLTNTSDISDIYDEQKIVATLEFKQETFNKNWRLIKLLID